MAQRQTQTVGPPYIAGMLAWLVPGAGHWYLGLRARGAILFVTITVIFWMGVIIGGIHSTVDPTQNIHWFLGEICIGSHTLTALVINRSLHWLGAEGLSSLKQHDIGLVYAGVAGLLNLLAVFDAIVRSVSGQVREGVAAARPAQSPAGDGPAGD